MSSRGDSHDIALSPQELAEKKWRDRRLKEFRADHTGIEDTKLNGKIYNLSIRAPREFAEKLADVLEHQGSDYRLSHPQANTGIFSPRVRTVLTTQEAFNRALLGYHDLREEFEIYRTPSFCRNLRR